MKTLQPPAAVAASSIIDLEGQIFRVAFVYDERLAGWHVSLYAQPDGRPIVEGWRLTDGQPVGIGAASPELWRGVLFALEVARGASLTTADDVLAGRAVVSYIPSNELGAPADDGFVVVKDPGDPPAPDPGGP